MEAFPRNVRFATEVDDHFASPINSSSQAQNMVDQHADARDSLGSASSGESDTEHNLGHEHGAEDLENDADFTSALTTPLETDHVPPLSGLTTYGRSSTGQLRLRNNGSVLGGLGDIQLPPLQTNGMSTGRPSRPSVVRMPSNAYAPQRRPNAYLSGNRPSNRHRASSANRARHAREAEYRAQEQAYVQRIRRDVADYGDSSTEFPFPDVAYSTGSASDEESPSTVGPNEEDPYDEDTQLLINDDLHIPEEELRVPANRERLQWHWMLTTVLTGDVVKQEKKRIIGGAETQGTQALAAELWMGIRAKVCGRTLQAQQRMVEDGRSKMKELIEEITAFEIQGEVEAGKTAVQQVRDILRKMDKCENIYPNIVALETAVPQATSAAYKAARDAIISWHNITEMINTELSILKDWVGNNDLDFNRKRMRTSEDEYLTDDSSFIDRILKEDGLRSLQSDKSLLVALNEVINKAKAVLIEYEKQFTDRHLPPFMEDIQTLINFPSRLVCEIIRTRLSHTKELGEVDKQGGSAPFWTEQTEQAEQAEQMKAQFTILLNLAMRIKSAYNIISTPEQGWDPAECLEENFDNVVLEAVNFYFKMLHWKLTVNKNPFKEAEILEQEWGFSNQLGKYFDGAHIVVAEQFGALTSRALSRLTVHFEKALQRRPEGATGAELERRYKSILDSVRIRQRKLFRFSRILAERYENCTEFNISLSKAKLAEIYEDLALTDHFLVENTMPLENIENHGIFIIASAVLQDRPEVVQSLLTTCFLADGKEQDASNPYILILKPEDQFLPWGGRRIKLDLRQPLLDVKPGRLRLIADGSRQQLANACAVFEMTIPNLTVVIEQRANLVRVNQEMRRIKKTTYKLSNAIMDSVAIIRRQTVGLQCQDLIQACFAFAIEFGQRSVVYMNYNQRAWNNIKITKLALDWVNFVIDDCVGSDPKTFRYTVNALESVMTRTRGQNILSISPDEYDRLRQNVSDCMSLLISHFDIMGARSMLAAQAERQHKDAEKFRFDVSRLRDDEESAKMVQEQRMDQLAEIEEITKQKEAERQNLGKVLEASTEADRALASLSSSATNVTMRWQQGNYIGGGSFGSVYAGINLDTGHLMAVKEIRLNDPTVIPIIVKQIHGEMEALQYLSHPNIVQYLGIEPHRDKVFIFMEYCSGGSLAGLLEYGRIEDETVIQVYALQMLEGLAYLHEKNVVHRDVKPENILLNQNGVIKFVDFGAAKIIAKQGRTLAQEHAMTRQGRPGSMTGTPMYMSPEVIKGEKRGRKGAVDIWSLGCVVLEMATGRRPWANLDNEWAIMYNIARGNSPALPTPDQLSELGIEFITQCFEGDPEKRPTAQELIQHQWLETIRADIMSNAEKMNLPPPTPSDSSYASSNASSRQNSGVFK